LSTRKIREDGLQGGDRDAARVEPGPPVILDLHGTGGVVRFFLFLAVIAVAPPRTSG